MSIEDISGLGKATHGLAKLIDSIKGFFVWGSEFSRTKRIIDKIGDLHLNAKSISVKTPSLEVKIDGADIPEAGLYLERVFKTKGGQIINEQINTDKVISYAIDEVKDRDSVSDKNVDEDWLINFFEHSKFANSEYMQRLWGKILATEIVQPDSFSIRALNTLRILKKSEAEKFSKLCSLLLRNIPNTYDMVLIDSQYLLNKFNIDGLDIEYLEEIGLINSPLLSYPHGFFANDNDSKAVFTYSGKAFLYEGENLNSIFMDIPFFNLTYLGKELFKLVDYTCQDDYIPIIKKCLVDNIAKKSKAIVNLSIADVDAAIITREGKQWVNAPSFTSLIT